ncbi:cytochrome c oxidase assembly protein, partial [Leucobacter sp. M11]|uniref:cytochrome c oxidase assembly protein n=1 Tax=Leucobacter sp. M11 TaxID=2993565 RepID=UPI002D801F6A
GAPMTLLLRSVRKRNDGSWGAREWVMWGIQTPWSKLVTNPIVAAIIFAGSLWIFYYTPLFRWAAEDHLGHQWMIIHFLISGYLFSLSLIGVDPVPKRFPYPIRLVTLLATMGFHAFFGVTIMSSTGLLLADWYGAMGRTWGAPPLEDQITGGGIAWGIGELPTLMLAIIVAVMWS